MAINYGAQFRQVRQRMKISVVEAAKLIGVDTETIRDHEYGKVQTTKADYDVWLAALESGGVTA